MKHKPKMEHKPKYDAGPRRVTFRQWLLPTYRRFRLGMQTLPHLESDLIRELDFLLQGQGTSSSVKLERQYLINSIANIRAQLRMTYRALSDIRKGIERMGISDSEIEKRIAEIMAGRRDSDSLLRQLRQVGGTRAALKRISFFLRPRFDSYTKCLKLAKAFDPSSDPQGSTTQLVLALYENLPDGKAEPDVMYKVVCLAGWLGLAVTIIVIAAIIIASEGETDDDDPDPPDDGDGDGDDEGGVCYPEEPAEGGVCLPGDDNGGAPPPA